MVPMLAPVIGRLPRTREGRTVLVPRTTAGTSSSGRSFVSPSTVGSTTPGLGPDPDCASTPAGATSPGLRVGFGVGAGLELSELTRPFVGCELEEPPDCEPDELELVACELDDEVVSELEELAGCELDDVVVSELDELAGCELVELLGRSLDELDELELGGGEFGGGGECGGGLVGLGDCAAAPVIEIACTAGTLHTSAPPTATPRLSAERRDSSPEPVSSAVISNNPFVSRCAHLVVERASAKCRSVVPFVVGAAHLESSPRWRCPSCRALFVAVAVKDDRVAGNGSRLVTDDHAALERITARQPVIGAFDGVVT